MWHAVYYKKYLRGMWHKTCAICAPAAHDISCSELSFFVRLDKGVEILAIDQNSPHISAVASAGTGHPNRREVAGKHQIASAPVAQANVVSRLLQGEQARFDCSRLNGLHSVLIVGGAVWNPFQVVPAASCKSFSGQTYGGRLEQRRHDDAVE